MSKDTLRELGELIVDIEQRCGLQAVDRLIQLAANAPTEPARWFLPKNPYPDSGAADPVERDRLYQCYRDAMWPWAWAAHLLSAVRRIDGLEVPQFDMLPECGGAPDVA